MAITFTDIIDLAKAGYKPADVKELIQLSKEAALPDKPDDAAPEDKDEPKKAAADGQEEPTGNEPEKTEKPIDYKELYEKEHAALEKLQKENTQKDVSQPEKDLDEILAEAMRGYM